MKIFIFLIISLLIISSLLLWLGINFPYNSYGQEEKFLIQKGENFLEISENLERKGFIAHKIYFIVYSIITGSYSQLQAGDYFLSQSMTIPEITKKFVRGDVVKIIVTIPEGFNLKEINQKLSASYPDSEKLEEMRVSDFQSDFEFFKDAPVEASLEGFLFPDTYQFSPRATIQEIVRKMLTNFDKRLSAKLKEEIKQQKKTIFEIVTMASMIEKEVKSMEDKKLVSGILWKRLEKGMPLQVDATISYITGKKTTKIPLEDLQIDSPYNTYKYNGLPLGPICNAGFDSILAAIYPQESEFWYYLSTPDGETIFSKTLEEHNIAKSKYLN